jgi:hypothetical protein
MPSLIRNALIVAAAALSLGCSAFDPLICTSEARAGISITVLDSASGTPVGAGARITATDGEFSDTVTTVEDYQGPYGLAHERAGSYTVTVEKAGYALWSSSDALVTRGECHVRTVQLTALLQP